MPPRSRTTWLAGVTLVAAAATAPSAAASAAWSAQGSGLGAGGAATMPAGHQPTASVVANRVTVSWPASTFASGAPVAGYVIARYNALNGAPAAVGAGCDGVVTATSCTEQSVPAGSWIYTDTPVDANWTGAASPPSTAVTVLPT